MKFLLIPVLLLSASLWAKPYTFTRDLTTPPRGGATQGIEVEYDKSPSLEFQRIQEPGLSKKEKDRRAILAMAGEYEVSFEFIETYLLETTKDLDTPYFSKATEFVKVIEKSDDFISLQHILVMFIKQGDQTIGPIVTKHWRQDWKWQAKKHFMYQGEIQDRKHWSNQNINQSQGHWVWEVFQVDDSPRYSGTGKWIHMNSASIFDTEYLSRPLPRREFSVRSDYSLLMGKENLIIHPTGWFHEQKAFKHVGNLGSRNDFTGSIRSREVGQNNYKRIKNFDFSAGKEYWGKTQDYWKAVRMAWAQVLIKPVALANKDRNQSLWQVQFKQAEDPKVQALSFEKKLELAGQTLSRFLK